MKLQTGARLSAAGALAITIACAPFAAHAEIAGGVIGCDAPGAKQGTGAVIGAVLGGLAGNSLAKHDRGTGTVIGATAGAATGSYVGCNMQKHDSAAPTRSSYSSSSRARTAQIEDDDEPLYTGGSAYPRERGFTPPGLAKKPYGMPPGQAKKYYGVGQRMPGAYVRDARYVLDEPRAYGLRRPPAGYRWVGIGEDAYLVRTKTGVITDVVRAILS